MLYYLKFVIKCGVGLVVEHVLAKDETGFDSPTPHKNNEKNLKDF